MKTLCLACLVYTLKDKAVEDNLYLNIFYMWLAKVTQSGGLTKDDWIQIRIDKRTAEYFNEADTVLPLLLERLPCSYSILTFDPPASSLEGMMNKYVFTEYTQDVYIYCDIDILISNPFHTMLSQTEKYNIYLCSEGTLEDPNYSAGFPEGVDVTLPGFSAGKFMIRGKLLHQILFNTINNICDYSSKFYTVEQPFFNRAVYILFDAGQPINNTLLTSYVSFNGDEYDKGKTVFNDLAGQAGDGLVHMKKVMDNMCLYVSGLY